VIKPHLPDLGHDTLVQMLPEIDADNFRAQTARNRTGFESRIPHGAAAFCALCVAWYQIQGALGDRRFAQAVAGRRQFVLRVSRKAFNGQTPTRHSVLPQRDRRYDALQEKRACNDLGPNER
jgi:hypothetical protein